MSLVTYKEFFVTHNRYLLLRLSVALVVVMDTVYGSQILLGTRPEYDKEEGKELDKSLRNHVGCEAMEEAGDKRTQGKKKQLESIPSWSSLKKTMRSLQKGDNLPTNSGDFWMEADVVNDGVARCPTSSGGQRGQDGQVLSTLLPPGIRWLSRAGLYLTLASSGYGTKMAQRALGGPLPIFGHCVVRIALDFSGTTQETQHPRSSRALEMILPMSHSYSFFTIYYFWFLLL